MTARRGANGRFIGSPEKAAKELEPTSLQAEIKARPQDVRKVVDAIFRKAKQGDPRCAKLILDLGLDEIRPKCDCATLTSEQIHAMSDEQLEAIVRGVEIEKVLKNEF
jgi:hypothetical protein